MDPVNSILPKAPIVRRKRAHDVADEIEKLDRLKASGSLSETEYKALRAKLI